MSERFSEQDAALLRLGELLKESGFHFITATPATHALVNARAENRLATSLSDVFGWSRPFAQNVVPDEIHDCAVKANAIALDGDGLWRSSVRFSSLGAQLFVHSAFPTSGSNAVFFGPDTYRFARLLSAVATSWNLPARIRLVDVGSGSGAGGIHLSRILEPRADVDLVLGDINPEALRLARINSALNSCRASVVESDVLNGVEGHVDIVIANPPYLIDAAQRVYRHGGGAFGGALSLRIVEESLNRLRPGGHLVLYTGSAVVAGRDTFFESVRPIVQRSGKAFTYEEIDADVFGEELLQEPYTQADRIAVVALCVG